MHTIFSENCKMSLCCHCSSFWHSMWKWLWFQYIFAYISVVFISDYTVTENDIVSVCDQKFNKELKISMRIVKWMECVNPYRIFQRKKDSVYKIYWEQKSPKPKTLSTLNIIVNSQHLIPIFLHAISSH